MLNTIGDIISRLGVEGIWIYGCSRINNTQLTRLDENLTLLELRALVCGDCSMLYFSEKGGESELCLFCSWLGCPENPINNRKCYEDHWQRLNEDKQMLVRAIFKDGYMPKD